MSVRPPKALAPKDPLSKEPLAAALEHEVLAEKAATYGRLVQKLEKALQALREYENSLHPSRRRGAPPQDEVWNKRNVRPHGEEGLGPVSNHEGASSRPEYEALLNTAGRALWYVMIQRDLCGFRRHDLFYKELNIPAAVRLRMGIARSQ